MLSLSSFFLCDSAGLVLLVQCIPERLRGFFL
jgi:hypothetical protein